MGARGEGRFVSTGGKALISWFLFFVDPLSWFRSSREVCLFAVANFIRKDDPTLAAGVGSAWLALLLGCGGVGKKSVGAARTGPFVHPRGVSRLGRTPAPPARLPLLSFFACCSARLDRGISSRMKKRRDVAVQWVNFLEFSLNYLTPTSSLAIESTYWAMSIDSTLLPWSKSLNVKLVRNKFQK
jgi:hypothetical protein